MAGFYDSSAPLLWMWVAGVSILGFALVYGVIRAGWLKPRERAQLDRATRAQQQADDPQKTSGMR